MHAQAIPAALARTLALYALAGSLTLTLWLKLPAWAPAWVLESSPFVLPAARAAVAGHDIQGFARRVSDWGDDALPGLRSCLRHHQVLVRRLAAQVLAMMAAHGPLDASLNKPLTVASDDDDEVVARWATRALHRNRQPRATETVPSALPVASPTASASASPAATPTAVLTAGSARLGDARVRRKARKAAAAAARAGATSAPGAIASAATGSAAAAAAAAAAATAATAAADDDDDEDDDDDDDMPGTPPAPSPH